MSQADRATPVPSGETRALSPEEVEAQQAADLPPREAMTLLSGVPTSAGGLPLPTGPVQQADLPSPNPPTANPGDTYSPTSTASSST